MLTGQKNPYSIQPVDSGYEPISFSQPKPNANGYLPLVDVPSQAGNPWSSPLGQQEAMLSRAVGFQAMIPNYQASLDQQMSAMNGYALSTQYPSYPNEFGLGSQTPFGAPSTPTQPANPSASSRGFNPWSLMGEALSR